MRAGGGGHRGVVRHGAGGGGDGDTGALGHVLEGGTAVFCCHDGHPASPCGVQTIDVNVYNLLNPPYFLTTGSSKGGTLTGVETAPTPPRGATGSQALGGIGTRKPRKRMRAARRRVARRATARGRMT
ncbi:hypothetical protein U2A4042610015 [Corynebacterium striatum]|nr:hypothetical protein U2A4042610015 [Corynebacterium striatum]